MSSFVITSTGADAVICCHERGAPEAGPGRIDRTLSGAAMSSFVLIRQSFFGVKKLWPGWAGGLSFLVMARSVRLPFQSVRPRAPQKFRWGRDAGPERSHLFSCRRGCDPKSQAPFTASRNCLSPAWRPAWLLHPCRCRAAQPFVIFRHPPRVIMPGFPGLWRKCQLQQHPSYSRFREKAE